MNSKRPHVVFFPAWYPHRGDPMPGLFVKHHALAAAKHADISILQVVGESRRDGNLMDYDFKEEDGLPTMRVYYRKSPGILGKIFDAYLYFLGTYTGYSKLIAKTRQADLHHVHILTRAGFFPWLIRRFGGAPYLITEHWSRYLPANRDRAYKGRLRRWLTKKVVASASSVSPVNEKLSAAMQEIGLKNAEYSLVNNVVDMNRFPLSDPPPSNAKFLHVSCFDEAAKNVKGILDALMIAVKQNPSVYLTLVGEGPDLEEVKAYSKSIGAELYTDFKGLLEGQDLVKEFQANNAFVLFSNYENQPVVILEALATGMPVISSKVGSVPEMLAEDRGILVDVGDTQSLAESMVALSTSPAKRNPASREYVAKKYSFESVGEHHKQLYELALSQ